MKNPDVYQRILEGKTTIKVARKLLTSEQQDIDRRITIIPTYVSNILQMYLRKEIDDKELSEWASFILYSDAYICPDTDDDKADKYEMMWYILQQLSTPFIDGEITEEGVRLHLQNLQSL